MADSLDLIVKYTLHDHFSAKADHIRQKAKQAAQDVAASMNKVNIAWGQSVSGGSTGVSFGGMSSGGGGFFSDLIGGMGEVASSVNPVSLAFKSVLKPMEMYIKTFLGAFEKMGQALLAGGGILAGFVALSIKAANEFDSMERTFGAMLGSAEKGKQMMAWLRQYGMTSGFTQDAIIESARSITALGLEVDKWLPTLEKFALFAGPDPSNLTEMAAIMRRLVGGQIADAFGPEGLGRFGINRNMLSQYGAQFDKQGSFIGGVTEALGVLERMATESPILKNLKAAFDDSPAVRFSNAVDAIGAALVDAGRVFQKAFLPYVDRFVDWMKNWVDGGRVTNFAQSIANAFEKLVDKAGGFEGIMNTIAAAIEQLPNAMLGIGTIFLGMGKMIYSIIKSITDFAVNNINTFIHAYNASLGQLVGTIGTITTGDDSTLLDGINTLTSAYNQFLLNSGLGVPEGGAGALGARLGAMATGSGAIGGPPALQTSLKDSTTTNMLDEIEKNTRITAENTSYLNPQRFALGGGDLGRVGLEYGEARRHRGSSPTVKVTGGSQLEQFFAERFADFMKQLQQQGWELKRTRA